MEQWLVIGISGVTCGGKSSLSNDVFDYFKERQGHEIKPGIELKRVHILHQDTYYRSIDHPNHQKIEKLNHINWEIIESIDMEKMINDITEILGKTFVIYNTRSSTRAKNSRHNNMFAHHFAGSPHQMKARAFQDNGELIADENDLNNFKIIKQNHVLNILIIEGILVFNHPVTIDLCNVKYHLHVPYEVCKARRNNRSYNPPDVLGKFINNIPD